MTGGTFLPDVTTGYCFRRLEISAAVVTRTPLTCYCHKAAGMAGLGGNLTGNTSRIMDARDYQQPSKVSIGLWDRRSNGANQGA